MFSIISLRHKISFITYSIQNKFIKYLDNTTYKWTIKLVLTDFKTKYYYNNNYNKCLKSYHVRVKNK